MHKCMKELFENKDLSKIKEYLQKKWAKILNGHVNFRDFSIAKEVAQ